MVGDSYLHDIEGARAVGMRGVLLRRGGVSPDGVRSADEPEAAVIGSRLELPAMLLGDRVGSRR